MKIALLLSAALLVAAPAFAQQRFVIERDIQWVQSYVAGDKIYCVYNAPSEAWIRSHAEKSGFPANKITPVSAVIDPTTAQAAR
jgi:hypothetical protein